jgi:hypothetical protein
MRRKRTRGNKERESPDGLMTDVAEDITNDDDDLIN